VIVDNETGRPNERSDERSAAPALTKGFAILDLIAQEPGIGFAAIRSRLGLPNSSCHHLISTLCKVGALQLQADRGYVLGLRLFELGTIAASQRKIEQSAMLPLKRLAKEVELTCHLGVMEGTEAVYLMKVEGQREIRVNTWIGKRLSLHSSSLGKVLLAWLPDGEIEDKLRYATWEAKTPSTITDPAQFRNLLKTVRARGWAFDDQEDAPSIRCVAAPVFDLNGRIIAAISAVGTVLDIEPERFPALSEKLRATAAEISANLGYGQVENL
jgi:DNA-binding IclR family transcriptional regulator